MTIGTWLLNHGADVIVALGTGALAFFTWRLAVATRATLNESKEDRRVAQEAARAANRAARAAEHQTEQSKRTADEAFRSRVDAEAPRVVFLADLPKWPPYLDRARHGGMPYRNELRLLDPESRSRSKELTADCEVSIFDDGDSLIWTYVPCVAINEGKSSSLVRIWGEMDAPLRHPDSYFGVALSDPKPLQSYAPQPEFLDGEYLLRPGEALYFECAWGAAVRDWVDAHEHPNPPSPRVVGFLRFQATDWVKGGITDFCFLEVGCDPLVAIEKRPGYWRLNTETKVGRTIYPVERRYMALDQGAPDAPWQGRYDDWVPAEQRTPVAR